jgi:hypothetical protein
MSNLASIHGTPINRPLIVEIPGEYVQAMIQALLDLSAEGEIRTADDGRLSIFDVIQAAGVKGNPRDSWKRLTESHPDVVEISDNVKLPRSDGRGASHLSPVADIAGCLEIIWRLPGDVSKKLRRIGAQVTASVVEQATKPVESLESAEPPKLSRMQLLLQVVSEMAEHEQKLEELEEKTLEHKQALEIIREQQSLIEGQQSLIQLQQERVRLMAEESQSNITDINAELGRYSDPTGKFYTILGYASLKGVNVGFEEAKSLGRTAAAYCRANGLTKETIHDARFGTVGNYPVEALGHAFKLRGLIA